MSVESKHDRGILRGFISDTVQERIDALKRSRRLKKHQNQPDMRPQAAVIFGAGLFPGIGAAISKRVAEGGLTVFVTGRNEEKVNATVEAIHKSGNKAEGAVVNVTDPAQISAVYERIHTDGFRLQLVVDNVGTNLPRPFLDLSAEMMERSWVNDCRAGFLIGQQAIKIMLEQSDQGFGRGTILYTGASASLRGKSGFASFAHAKAGLRVLAQAMAREYGPQGIHVAHVIIDGLVDGARLREHWPDLLDKQGENGALDPEAIAEIYWQIHKQHRSAWTHELDLRPFKETW